MLLADRLAGVLLGTALGDALGLPAEGMSPRAIARRFGRVDRFRLLGSTGYVSDDTEQAALVAQSLILHPGDPIACAAAFRRSLFGWFCRLPFGVGKATILAAIRIGLGLRPSGVRSAGNGAAMRAAIVGAFFADDPAARLAFGRALAETTHTDPRAVEGALYVAEIAAIGVRLGTTITPADAVAEARRVVADPTLGPAIDRARSLARDGASVQSAAEELGTSGYVVATCAFATFVFLRSGPDPLAALSEAISAGGDADSIAAILGGWLGARLGPAALPAGLIAAIDDGPFGPTHLRALAEALALAAHRLPAEAPPYSPALALGRNLFIIPVAFAHIFRRLADAAIALVRP